MTKVICSARETCEEAEFCGGAKPHTQVNGCSKCGMHDQECEPVIRNLEPDTIKAKAGHDLKAGDAVYLSSDKKHWFKRLILWIAFLYTPKPVVYKVESVSSNEFTYGVE